MQHQLKSRAPRIRKKKRADTLTQFVSLKIFQFCNAKGSLGQCLIESCERYWVAAMILQGDG